MRRRKLVLRAETVRVLGAAALRQAHGGQMAESTGVPCISYFCSGTTGDLSRADPCGYTYQVGDCQTSIPYPP